jgi:hypothetical protein
MMNLTWRNRESTLQRGGYVDIAFWNRLHHQFDHELPLYERSGGWTWEEAFAYSPSRTSRSKQAVVKQEVQQQTAEQVEQAKADRRSRRSAGCWTI